MKTKINARAIKDEMKRRRGNEARALTFKAIQIINDCFDTCDYSPAHELNIYTKHSGMYCELLEVLSAYRKAVISC